MRVTVIVLALLIAACAADTEIGAGEDCGDAKPECDATHCTQKCCKPEACTHGVCALLNLPGEKAGPKKLPLTKAVCVCKKAYDGPDCLAHSVALAHAAKAPPPHGLNPSNFVVVLIAVSIITFCAFRAIGPATQSEAVMAVQEAGEMQLWTTVAFVGVASLALVLIFFFMKAMSVLITVIFCFSSTMATMQLLYPYAETLTQYKFSKEIEVPVVGPTPLLAIFLTGFSACIVALWLLTKSWILNDVLAFALCCFFLSNIRLSSIKVATLLLTMLFFYDIFWVFLSKHIFGKNVMVTIATGLDVPMKIQIPLILGGGGKLQFTLIGLGDIVLPGMLICFLLRYDHTAGSGSKNGYFIAGIIGYTVGLIMCEVIVGTTHIAQPAMIYLVPGTLGSCMALAYKRDEVKLLWEGLETEHERLLDSDEIKDGLTYHTSDAQGGKW
jgi:hypothetical protein